MTRMSAITFRGRDQRQAETCVSGGRLDDRAPGFQLSFLLGGFDHRERDTILNRASRVLVLQLDE